MNQEIYIIKEHLQLTESVYKIVLTGNALPISKPGQFVNIKIEDLYLRRPFSVCDYNHSENTITIVYKIVGEGTRKLSLLKEGEKLDILAGLGNGFDIDIKEENPLIIGGGVGIPPLYNLAKQLKKRGKNPTVILCFNTKNEIFLLSEFKNIGVETLVATVDGSYGTKGFFSDVVLECSIEYDYYYCCGPLLMLKKISEFLRAKGQISMEERMGCGFGGCMGCTHKTTNGYKRICVEGPVFFSDELMFD